LHKKFRLVAATGVESKGRKISQELGLMVIFRASKRKKAPQLALKGFRTRNGTNVEPVS
jgi:hypothetical protein